MEEEVFLCHLRTLDTCCAKQELLLEIADSMYGKRTGQLDPKPSTSYARGEIVLCEKAVLYLQTQMEHLHYSVTQRAFNMAKIAGDLVIPFYFVFYPVILNIASFNFSLEIPLPVVFMSWPLCRFSTFLQVASVGEPLLAGNVSN